MAPSVRREWWIQKTLRNLSLMASAAARAASRNRSLEEADGVCPPLGAATGLASAYVGLFWVRQKCVGFFPEADLSEAEVRPVRGGGCEVRLRQLGGELRVLLGYGKDSQGSNGIARGAVVRVAAGEPWVPVGQRICLVAMRPGYVPLPKPVNPRVQKFAIAALNEARASRSCGSPLQLHSMGALVAEQILPSAGVMGRSVQLRFSILVVSSHQATSWDSHSGQDPEPRRMAAASRSARSLPGDPVLVAVEAFMGWDDTKLQLLREPTMTYLGSDPDPCHLGVRLRQGSGAAAHQSWSSRAPGPPAPVPVALRGSDAADAKDSLQQRLRLLPKSERLTKEVLFARGLSTLPEDHDLRTSAPRCVEGPIRRQGRCAGAWALAAVGSFEKQACALTHGRLRPRLSAQHVLDCSARSTGCLGGRIEDALAHLYDVGAVPEECAAWSAPRGLDSATSEDLKMPIESLQAPSNLSLADLTGVGATSSSSRCREEAAPRSGSRCERLRARLLSLAERAVNAWPHAPVGVLAVRGEQMIQAAILAYAAVATVVEVYADFLGYESGVYHRARTLGPHDVLGVTAVQLLGWGQLSADGVRYWIGENSFGHAWGEGGFFRWVRGKDHLGIERRALLALVAGLSPLNGGGGDQLTALQRKVVDTKERAGRLEVLSRWLIACSLASTSLSLCAIVCAVRRCLCPGKGFAVDGESEEEEEEEDGDSETS